MKRISFILLFLLSGLSLFSQSGYTLYNMHGVPQAAYVNPGRMPDAKLYIGIPTLSSTYLNFSNSGFHLANLVQNGTNGVSFVNSKAFIQTLKPINFMNFQTHLELLSFGIKLKKNYFAFSLSDKAHLDLHYSRDFFSFLIEGNGSANNLGRPMDLSFRVNSTYYREWAFQYTRTLLADRLTIGGRVKFLGGMYTVNTKSSELTLTTDSLDYTLHGNANVQINTSGLDSATDHLKNIMFNANRPNKGMSIDLGATLKITNKWSASLSVIDIGAIKWTNNVKNYRTASTLQNITYNGFNLENYIKDSTNADAESSINKAIDSLRGEFQITESNESFTTQLPARFYASLNYQLNEKSHAALLTHGLVSNRRFIPGLTLSYNRKVGNWFSVSATYSIINRSFNNFGLGFAFTGPVQFYVVSDNLQSVMMYDLYRTENGARKIPAYAKNINVRFGINLVFGRNKEKAPTNSQIE